MHGLQGNIYSSDIDFLQLVENFEKDVDIFFKIAQQCKSANKTNEEAKSELHLQQNLVVTSRKELKGHLDILINNSNDFYTKFIVDKFTTICKNFAERLESEMASIEQNRVKLV